MHPGLALSLVSGFLLVFAFAAATPPTYAASRESRTLATVTVEAGPSDRSESLVSFPWPAPLPSPTHLRGPGGRRLPVQWSGSYGWFIQPRLAAHATQAYDLVTDAPAQPAKSRLRIETNDDSRTLFLDDLPALTYLGGAGQLPRPEIPEPYRRGGYLHPIRTPSGRIVTDDYPALHLHHHGLWFSWTKTVFQGRSPDFWNMGEKKGRTDFEAWRRVEIGPVFAELGAHHKFTDLLAQPATRALDEEWNVRLLALGGRRRFFAFDLLSEQRCAGTSALTLAKYIYGGLAYRGPAAWNGTNQLRYLDSNGCTNRLAANETRARWHWMGGLVDGRIVGIASLGHPDNFRAPQPLRIHPQEPYSCWAPSQLGPFEIQPGETYRSRYRLVVLDGYPKAAELDRLWNDFAQPPITRVSPRPVH